MRNCTILLALLTAFVLVMFAGTAQAATYDWTRNGASFNFQWDEGNGDHWNPDTGLGYPDAVGDVANFQRDYKNVNSNPQKVIIDQDILVGTIVLGDTTNSNRPGQHFTISSGKRLVMDDTDGIAEILRNDNDYNFPITFYGPGTIKLNDNLVISNECPTQATNKSLRFYSAIVQQGVRSVTKKGPGLVVFEAANTYSGETQVEEGRLILNGSTSRNQLQDSCLVLSAGASVGTWGSAAHTFNLGGLKGEGELLSGGGPDHYRVYNILSPGIGGVGELTSQSNITIYHLAKLDDGSIIFDLGADTTAGSTYDHLSMPGYELNIGESDYTLDFDDFTFNPVAGFGAGTYTLFDTGSLLGSIGTATGTIGAYNGTLSLSGGDVLLSVTGAGPPGVIPEPSTFTIWSLGLLGLAWYGRRRRRAR